MISDASTYALIATSTDVSDDGYYVATAFFDDSGEARKYFCLQRFTREEEYEIEGDDGPYMELNDQKWGCYNGLDSIEVGKHGIAFGLNERGIKKLGYSKIYISFGDSADKRRDVVRELTYYHNRWKISLSS